MVKVLVLVLGAMESVCMTRDTPAAANPYNGPITYDVYVNVNPA